MPLQASNPLHGLVLLAILLALNTGYGGQGAAADTDSSQSASSGAVAAASNSDCQGDAAAVSGGEGHDSGYAASSVTKAWRHEDYPNPREDPDDCKRHGRVSWICDPDEIMTKEQADELDALLEDVRRNTSCACSGECDFPNSGFHIAIALMKEPHSTKNKDHITEMDKFKETESFARFLQESGWDYGHCDDDAVIVVSMNYRKVWTSMGLTFKEKVSDWCVHHIYKEVRHTIWDGNVSQGLYDMIDWYGSVLSGRTECEVGIRPGSIIFILAMVSFGLCAVISFISFFRQRFKGCGNSPERV